MAVICSGQRRRPAAGLCMAALLGVSLSSCPPRVDSEPRPTDAAAPPRAEALLAKLREDLARLRPYHAVLEHEVRPEALGGPLARLGDQPGAVVHTRTRIWADAGQRIAFELRTELHGALAPGDWRSTQRLYFNGQTAWIEKRVDSGERAAPALEHSRLDQRLLARGRAPLDVGVVMWGHGLRRGHELIGTVRALLDRYTFEPGVDSTNIRGEPCHLLHGRRAPEALLDSLFDERDPALGGYLLARRSGALPDQVVDKIARGVVTPLRARERLRLYLSSRDGSLRGWAFGEGSPAAAELLVTDLEAGVPFPAQAVAPTEEMIARTEDRTEERQKERAQLDQAFADEVAVEAARTRLRQLLRERPEPARSPAAP